MKISHIEHLGIAVKSIEEALPYYENVLGLKCYNIETVEDQKVRTAFRHVGPYCTCHLPIGSQQHTLQQETEG